jgi:hypothetical protein
VEIGEHTGEHTVYRRSHTNQSCIWIIPGRGENRGLNTFTKDL